jgi:hypothetical protein
LLGEVNQANWWEIRQGIWSKLRVLEGWTENLVNDPTCKRKLGRIGSRDKR